jgi:hypothetical protein
MVKRKRAVIIASIAVVFLGSLLVIADKLTDTTGPTAIQRMDPHDLEKELRHDLPVGSSMEAVEAYLRKRGLDLDDSRSGTVSTTVRNVRGSSLIIRRDFHFKFFFDHSSHLESMDAKEYLTGL